MVLQSCRVAEGNGDRLDDPGRDQTGYTTEVHRVHRAIFDGNGPPMRNL